MMNDTFGAWSRRDLMFVGETLVPARTDRDHVTELLQSDEPLLCAMLEDERLFERMIVDEGILRGATASSATRTRKGTVHN
jgi:hypothetical protein